MKPRIKAYSKKYYDWLWLNKLSFWDDMEGKDIYPKYKYDPIMERINFVNKAP